jgi:hypothetical protein
LRCVVANFATGLSEEGRPRRPDVGARQEWRKS